MKFNEYRCLKNKVYAKGVPGYPDALIYHLIKHGWLSNDDIVANITAGSGRLSELISHCADTVYAIESDREELSRCKSRCSKRDNVISINALPEHTTLPNNSIDFIIITEDYDKIDTTALKKECERILKPKGRVMILWNEIDMSRDIAKVLSALNTIYFNNFRNKEHGYSDEHKPFKGFFYGHYYKYKFPNVLKYDLITFLASILSADFAPTVFDNNFHTYANELQKIFKRFEHNDMIDFPYMTRCYIGMMDDHIESTDILKRANRSKRPRKRPRLK